MNICKLFFATALGLFALTKPAPLGQAETKPNLIFILADDLGYGDLGCFGQKKIKTPHLDRLAKGGMKLTQFYSGSTVCAPSRCVLMTGLHTGHAYIRGNGRHNLRPAISPWRSCSSSPATQPAALANGDFGNEGTDGLPTKQGFDTFYGYLHQGHAHNFYPTFLINNERRVKLRNVPANELPSGAGWAKERIDYSHDLIVENALHWLDMNHKKPFFLYLPFTIPHANNEGTRGTGDGQDVPDYGIYAEKKWSNPNKGQAAMITRMDADIGHLMTRLKQYNLTENTLVVFSSDNGHHREGGNDPDFFDANGPLRGMKRDLYEGGIRVPTIAHWPGHIKPDSASDHPAYFGDLMATAAELLGECARPTRQQHPPHPAWPSGQAAKARVSVLGIPRAPGVQAVVLGETGRMESVAQTVRYRAD